MKKRISAIVCTLAVLFTCLSGCTPDVPPPAPPAPPPPAQVTDEPVQPVPEGEQLLVHFIDVGQADAALLQCGGENLLIDGGNREDSSLLVSYLDLQGVSYLDYVVCTHAHEDHVGGLSGPLNTLLAGCVYAPVTEYDSKTFTKFVEYATENAGGVTVPQPDETFTLGGATVTVLGPRREYEDPNDTSIVLRVDYGETSFLFTGDMERLAEEDLIADGCDLEVDVLKVGHHGSSTSSSYPFLRAVMPTYGVISVGEGNDYGHPHDEILSRYSDADVTLYRTDELGTIVACSDGSEITFSFEKGEGAVQPETGAAPEQAEPDPDQQRIANINSRVFHRADCANLPAEHNRVTLDNAEAALELGYTPCGNCKP